MISRTVCCRHKSVCTAGWLPNVWRISLTRTLLLSNCYSHASSHKGFERDLLRPRKGHCKLISITSLIKKIVWEIWQMEFSRLNTSLISPPFVHGVFDPCQCRTWPSETEKKNNIFNSNSKGVKKVTLSSFLIFFLF